MKRISGATFLMLVISVAAGAENFRTLVAGQIAVSADSASSDPAALPTLGLSYIDSALIALKTDPRFLRGVELELKVPQAYLKYRGSLAIAIYKAIGAVPTVGVADVSAERIGFELIPNKLQAVYQIPARKGHGLKASPYVSIPTGIVPPEAFHLLFRIWPVIKGLPEELEQLRFSLTAKPILTDEGALKLTLRYPEKLKDRNVTLRIDDEVRDPAIKEFMLKEGEHNLVIVSDDYRNESRAFTVERGKILEIALDLKDPTPIVSVEAPENARIYFDGQAVANPLASFPAEAGDHEIRFEVGDYSVVKPVVLLRGRSYRISLSIDVVVTESE